MPVLQIRELNPHVYLGFWKIKESPKELYTILEGLTNVNQADLLKFTNPTRQRQWLAGRVLAYTLLPAFSPVPLLLQNNTVGKPEFPGSAFRLSISHCQDLAAVILSDKYEVGIDIEFISPKVMRVRDKFMTVPEKTAAAEDLEKTLIYWSGKETLYKLYSKKQLVFKEHLFIDDFHKLSTGITAAHIITPDFRKSFSLQYEILDQHILTYSIDC